MLIWDLYQEIVFVNTVFYSKKCTKICGNVAPSSVTEQILVTSTSNFRYYFYLVNQKSEKIMLFCISFLLTFKYLNL